MTPAVCSSISLEVYGNLKCTVCLVDCLCSLISQHRCSLSLDQFQQSSLMMLPYSRIQNRIHLNRFPIDTPLVLRLVKTHMGKCLFSPELKSYLITQWNCTTIGSCRCRKRTNGSAAELHEPMATIRANIPAETGGASGYISGRFAIGSSDFFSFSDDDFVYADPEKPTRRWHASQ